MSTIMSDQISKQGFYKGAELMWGLQDVEIVARDYGYKLTDEDLKRVLIAAFEDNEDIMMRIREDIESTLIALIDSGDVKPAASKKIRTFSVGAWAIPVLISGDVAHCMAEEEHQVEAFLDIVMGEMDDDEYFILDFEPKYTWGKCEVTNLWDNVCTLKVTYNKK